MTPGWEKQQNDGESALTKRERALLGLLLRAGELTGRAIQAGSRGLNRTWLVYFTLYGLEERGFVASRALDPATPGGPCRRAYRVTPDGSKAVMAYAAAKIGRALARNLSAWRRAMARIARRDTQTDGSEYARCITRDQDWGAVSSGVHQWGRTVPDDDSIN